MRRGTGGPAARSRWTKQGKLMIYNLDEKSTLYDDVTVAATGALRDMIALALTWDEERFDTARIETPTQEVYSPDMIEEIAYKEDIMTAADDGHPS